MNTCDFEFFGMKLSALPSGALLCRSASLLVVSDLHLGKAARYAMQGGAALPPYEARETLHRIEADLRATGAGRVICLGDSFDRAGIESELPAEESRQIARLQDGRDWIWITGNHDPAPLALGGRQCAEQTLGPLTFRHIAQSGARAEISGHYHPKALLRLRGRSLSLPCFLLDEHRIVMPAYGAYTGGLRSDSEALTALMQAGARAILTGARPVMIPMPRG